MDQTVLEKLQNFAHPLSGNYTIDLRNLLFSIDIDRREEVFSEILRDESLDEQMRFTHCRSITGAENTHPAIADW